MEKEKNYSLEKYKKMFEQAITDLKTKGRRHRQIPNILTVLRLTAPFFIIPSAVMGNIPLVIGLTAGFGLTDLVDGIIARKCGLTSELGKDLDAICDKIFAGTLLITASLSNPILLCNLVLEGTIAGINLFKTAKEDKVVSSTKIGKLKTPFLFILAGIGLLAPLININPLILDTMVGLTAALQGLTIASYLSDNSEDTKEENHSLDSVNENNSFESENQEQKEKTKTKSNSIQELNSLKSYLIESETDQVIEEKPKTYSKNINNK